MRQTDPYLNALVTVLGVIAGLVAAAASLWLVYAVATTFS